MLQSGDDISPVWDKIREDRGIDFSLYRDGTLRRRLSRRLAARGCEDVPSYVALLERDAAEYDLLLRDLTIKYTEFYRDPFVFDIIGRDVIPCLAAENDGGELAIWSAGCATGEEAYSLAAMIRQMNASDQCELAASILGTDIDPAAVDAARCASYAKDIMPMPLSCEVAGYLRDEGKRMTASPEIRELVRFAVHDLTSVSAGEDLAQVCPGPFDLILCRNVLMYLHRPAQAKVLEMCCNALRPGGFLVVGTGETIPRAMETELKCIEQKAKIYRKWANPHYSG